MKIIDTLPGKQGCIIIFRVEGIEYIVFRARIRVDTIDVALGSLSIYRSFIVSYAISHRL
jgi:hypothetical protein